MGRKGSLTRRSFLERSAAVAGAALAGAGEISFPRKARSESQQDANPVIDCHAHLHHPDRPDYQEKDRLLIEAADKLGIDQLCCSTLTRQRPSTLEGFRSCNASLVEVIKRFPGRVLGYCFVNPGYPREAIREIRHYVEDHGFMGVKLYNAYRCTEPIVFPIVELAIELGVPILHHAGHRHHPDPTQPRISDGGDLAELSGRYPEAKLICAHIGGGGDWEWTIKAARNAPGVFLDTSGSVTDEGIVEMAARVVGVDRLLFGCDMSMTAGVGKIRGADLTPEEKRRILGGNMKKILALREKS